MAFAEDCMKCQMGGAKHPDDPDQDRQVVQVRNVNLLTF